MSSELNIIKLFKNHLGNPSFILDDNGKILDFNNSAESVFPKIKTNYSLFSLFNKEDSQTIEELLEESKNFQKNIKENCYLTIDEKVVTYDVVISPIKTVDGIRYVLSLLPSANSKKEIFSSELKIVNEEIEKYITDDNLKEIIQLIKETYPFSFIAKSQLQSQIDKLGCWFWVKNNRTNFEIINDRFSKYLGLDVFQVIGKNNRDFLSNDLIALFDGIEKYILSTQNPVITQSEKLIDPITKNNLKIIEFPISDMDGNIVALVGFSSEIKTKEKNLNLDLLEVLGKPAVILNDSLEIINKNKLFDNISFGNAIVEKDILPTKINQLVREMFNENLDQKSSKFVNDNNVEQFNVKFERIKYHETDCVIILFEQIQKPVVGFSDSLYDRFLEYSPLPYFIYDSENLKFLNVNAASLNLYGYLKDEFVQLDLADLYSPEDMQTLIRLTSIDSADGELLGPYVHQNSRGNNINVKLAKYPIKYQNKSAYLTVVLDISLQLSQNKLLEKNKVIADNSISPNIITDKDGFIQKINSACANYLESSSDDLVDNNFISILADESRGEINRLVFSGDNKSVQNIECKLKNTSTKSNSAELIVTPILNHLNEIESFIIIFAPETPAKYERIDVAGTQKKMIEEGKAVVNSSFLSNLFHEILTPINVILGFMQELIESIENPDEEQVEAITIIKDNQKLLLQIMNNAVEYVDIQEKNVTINIENLKFTEILEDIISLTSKNFRTHQVELKYGKISNSLVFKSDKKKFVSLLTQVLNYSAEVTGESQIYISAQQKSEHEFIVGIKDTPTGISAKLLSKLRELTLRIDNSKTENVSGNEFNVKLLVKLISILNVKIETISKDESPLEYGLIFKSELDQQVEIDDKIKKVDNVDEVIEESTNDSNENQLAESVVGSSNDDEIFKELKLSDKYNEQDIFEVNNSKDDKTKLDDSVFVNDETELNLNDISCLYVEDQIDSQILFKFQMKEIKEIQFAQSFEKALPILDEKKFDFIMMDINLQGEYNGLDALRILQKIPDYQKVPVIAVTAYVLPGDKEKFLAAGFSGFVSKPLLRDKIIPVVKKVLPNGKVAEA